MTNTKREEAKMSTLNTQKVLATTAGVTVAIGSLLTFGQGALAESRVTFGTTWDQPGDSTYAICDQLDAASCSLQDLLDSITVSGPGIDTTNDQTNYNYFTNTASGGSLGSFMFEVAGFAPDNEFGIYQYGNPLKKAALFSGSNDWGDSTTMNFLGDGSIYVSTTGLPGVPGDDFVPPDGNLYTDFGNVFGFYLTNKNGQTFYTDDALNPGEKAQALIYQGDDATTLELPGKQPGTFSDNEFIIAFEDLARNGSTDSDFNDLVVMVESIEPVPEPTTIAGLGLIAGSLAMTRRRKNS
jgi:hypothetical protein